MKQMAIAYVRRSAPGASLSYEEQRTAIRSLAARQGDQQPIELTDVGKSGADAKSTFGGTGRGGARKRTAYQELRQLVEQGQVATIYAYSMSRLARSTRELLSLAELLAEHRVTLHLVKEGTQDFTTPSGRLFLTILAAVSAFEAEVSSDRTADRVASARSRGEYVGRPPFGYRLDGGRLVKIKAEQATIKAVTRAYAREGSLERTAGALNVASVASPTGVTWQPTTVRRILEREGIVGPADKMRAGSRLVPTAIFARLLRCAHCGAMLSPARKPRADHDWIGYRCVEARYRPDHPRPLMISEAAVRAWAETEAAHLTVPYDVLEVAAEADEARAGLEVRRARIVELYVSGSIERAAYDRLVGAVDAKLSATEARLDMLEIPASVDWQQPAAILQPILAALWSRVTVDLVNRTFTAQWRRDEWRAP